MPAVALHYWPVRGAKAICNFAEEDGRTRLDHAREEYHCEGLALGGVPNKFTSG